MPTSNYDPSEIAKFSALAETWWDPSGPCKPLHAVNPTRLQFINDCVMTVNQQRILDIGCGGGLLSETLAQAGGWVTGIDKSTALIDIAIKHAQSIQPPIVYQITDAESLLVNQPSATFDIICCMELLEHVPDPQALINACSHLVRPGGWLFFSTINRTPYAYLTAIIGAEYLLKLLPKGTHDYEKFIRPSELATLARQAKLSLKKLQGMTYHPWSNTASLSKQVQGNYLAAFQKHSETACT